jgi:hypothetical protein
MTDSDKWDEARVEREAQALVAQGKQPIGSYPAALWERYWNLRLARDQLGIFRLGARPDEEKPARVVKPSAVRAYLLGLGWPDDTRVSIKGGRFDVEVPLPWRDPIGISVRQVSK